tara:strand:+ start:1324 stop:1989 length:666 start_codon:yes stop_codon:yes gene_type:complete
MAVSALLQSIKKRDVNEFRKDLLGMLRVVDGLDMAYGQSNLDVSEDIKKFDSLIKSFNKKYKNLKLKLIKKSGKIELKILLNEKAVKDAFENSASKIMGLQSIGVSSFGAVMTSDPDSFTKEINKIKNKLYMVYGGSQNGLTKVFLVYDKKARKVQLAYDVEDIGIEFNPEFQIAAYYALNGGYNEKIKIYEEASTLGFSLWPDHNIKNDYFHKFYPHSGE